MSDEEYFNRADNFYQRTLDTGPDMIRRILTEPMKEHDLDALVAPTGSCPPEPLPSAEDVDYECKDTPSRTLLGNISGYPEVAVPAGFTSNGLPISVAFLGPAFSEPTLLGLAYSYEQATIEREAPDSYGPVEKKK